MSVLGLCVAGAVASSSSVMAADFGLLDQSVYLALDPATMPAPEPVAPPPPPEAPNIHGFAAVPFKTAYVTPRGLVVENQGLVIQPIVGLVLPIGDVGPFEKFAIVSGIWNCITTNQSDTNVGGWNEMDYFLSFGSTVSKDWNLALTYGAWNFPQSTELKPSTEHNLDLKITYNDAKLWGKSGFALNPYVDLWWAISGSSTVVLGKQGDTGYVELGIGPGFKLAGESDYPVSITIPAYFSVGPESYWGDPESGGDPDGNFGVASVSVNASVPLAFIPTRYGFWHADAGVSYFYLINDNLLNAGTILSGNDDRNVFVASLGIGFGF
jgi:hypothetical protein